MNAMIHGLKRAALVFLLPALAFAEGPSRPSDDPIWRQVPGEAMGFDYTSAAKPTVYELDEAELDNLLWRAPEEFSTAFAPSPVLSLPMPDGSLASFRVMASTILEPELAARFPTIQTFLLAGLDEATPRGRLDHSGRGLHALVLTRAGAVRIDPDDQLGPPYYRSTFATSTAMSARDEPFCRTREEDAPTLAGAADGVAEMHDSARPTKGNPAGETLRLYRLAVATTGEYYADNGSSDEDVMAAIVTVINRVNLIFETEVAVRFVLIGDNDRLLFKDAAGDGYSNHQPCLMQAENTPILNATVGTGSYDVGHVFGNAPGGGCAAGSVVCRASSKGHGASSLSAVDTPGGVSAYRIVAHHLAHQFGAHHTWSGADGLCIAEQFHAGSAYEPLSGTTLMAYPGDCGGDDLEATAADLTFHTRSFDQIVDFVTSEQGKSCATRVATGNRAPLVDAGPDFTIPRETPFRLEGVATDLDGDSLAFSWEQFDAAPERVSPLVDRGDNPLFRSFPPLPGSAMRTLPRFSALLANTPSPGEILPTTYRTLTFRLTARDGRGGVDYDSMRITVAGPPFELLSPNGGETLAAGCAIPVLWDVGGGGNVASEVDILLSADGGESFTTLLARAANDGEHQVSTCTTTERGRLELAAVDQIFFDLSNGDFSIASAAPRISAEASGGVADESCEARVTFSALATDDCGIDADDVSVAVRPLADTLIVGEPEITLTQLDNLTVSVAGSVPVTGLGADTATLELDFLASDQCGLATTRTVAATVAGSDLISGSITSPADCQCFGPTELPVTVADSFASTCSALTRIYSPAPPPYLGHGDYDVTLTVETADASVADQVSFTIDLVPPGLDILSPEATTYNGMAALPIPIRFTSRDADGAAGGVVHERILLDGEVLFDGDELGDRDGRLSDELPNLESSGVLALDLATLCASASGLQGVHTLTVEAEDCGANLAEASVAFEISLPDQVCQVVERHTLVINELDYDQGSVDDGEFIEIKNIGSEPVDLRDYALRTVYQAPFDTQPRSVRYAIDAEDAFLEPGEYFVICGDDNPGDYCDQRVSPTGYGIAVPELLDERSAAAAVALVYNPLQMPRADRLVDSVCYFDADHLESDQGVPGGIAGGKWTETLCNNQLETVPGAGISRLRDGQDRDHNRVDFRQACITPGAANLASARDCDSGGQVLGRLVINELDYNQPEDPDNDFVEIKNVGETAVNLGDYQLVHRRLDTVGLTPEETRSTLSELVLAPGQLFVVCRSLDAVPGCNVDGLFPLDDTSGAVALTHNVSGQAVHDLLIDSIAYGELDDATVGGPLSGGSWAEGAPEDEGDDRVDVGLSRACGSADSDDNSTDFRLVPLTPGAENARPAVPLSYGLQTHQHPR